MTDTVEETVYACESSSGFTFRVGTVTHKFEKHQLKLSNAEEIEAMDEALTLYPAIGRRVKKVDSAAAEALVKNHIATHGGAHSGPFSSNAMAQMETDKLEGRDAAFAKMSPEEKATITDAMAKDGDLILTQKQPEVATPVSQNKLTDNTKPPVTINSLTKKA